MQCGFKVIVDLVVFVVENLDSVMLYSEDLACQQPVNSGYYLAYFQMQSDHQVAAAARLPCLMNLKLLC